MAGVPGTSSAIFSAVKDVGANVIMISQVANVLYFRCVHYSSRFFLTIKYCAGQQ
jgi:hypothetical protein